MKQLRGIKKYCLLDSQWMHSSLQHEKVTVMCNKTIVVFIIFNYRVLTLFLCVFVSVCVCMSVNTITKKYNGSVNLKL